LDGFTAKKYKPIDEYIAISNKKKRLNFFG
jgi:hypothetical protein